MASPDSFGPLLLDYLKTHGNTWHTPRAHCGLVSLWMIPSLAETP
jgi:hypothetical protein